MSLGAADSEFNLSNIGVAQQRMTGYTSIISHYDLR
ncbi:hypothetical protein MLPM_0152 [Mycobacterium lepromatosis]|uniref:Uncharacterized protein n=1 Tax=Mycobacterium lepromatosis TaxID=480418 RepID=A0A0F4ES61_9MYCO|nr:hypothetical protein MLPM_0152 [Mycobacterium lepromatosis]